MGSVLVIVCFKGLTTYALFPVTGQYLYVIGCFKVDYVCIVSSDRSVLVRNWLFQG